MARRGLLLVLLALLALPIFSQTKYALVIGLGKQEDRAWPKINGDKDVPRVRQMLRKSGYDKIISLVNERATKRNILSAFNTLVGKARPGDIFYIHYSGHGQQVADPHHDEHDGLDECWIPIRRLVSAIEASATYPMMRSTTTLGDCATRWVIEARSLSSSMLAIVEMLPVVTKVRRCCAA